MASIVEFGPQQIAKLSEKILKDLFEKTFYSKTTIFLCGAGEKTRNSVREQIANGLMKSWLSYRYDLFYPEELFFELMSGPRSHDLLSLENTLAGSVDVIVLVLESVGAISELGAFVSNDALRKKIVCVQDKKYKKQKSFINYGPIRLLKKSNGGKHKLVNVDYGRITEKDISHIQSAINAISKNSIKSANITNILQTENFILPCIYLLEPVPRKILVDMVKCASSGEDREAVASTTVALEILEKKKLINLTSKGYLLTLDGMERFHRLSKNKKTHSVFDLDVIDQIRLDILSWQYRKKPLMLS